MTDTGIKFGAIVPPKGFRWLAQDADGRWHLTAPPRDWPAEDYRAFADLVDPPPVPQLADKFHLAAGVDECLQVHEGLRSEFGRIVSEPDLYLKFASERPTPGAIRKLANAYGLLRYWKTLLTLDVNEYPEIAAEFPVRGELNKNEKFSIFIESAADWLGVHGLLRSNIERWQKWSAEGNYAAMHSYIETAYNYDQSGSLTFQAKVDPDTGATHSEIMASSLRDALDVQWGMSVTSDISHRQCAECPTWFAVHPGEGRPEKQYCSDACRMRAYRKRKTANSEANNPDEKSMGAER